MPTVFNFEIFFLILKKVSWFLSLNSHFLKLQIIKIKNKNRLLVMSKFFWEGIYGWNEYTVSFFDESKWNFGICWPRFIPCIPILKAKPCEVKCCCSICMYLTRKKYRIIVFKQQTFLASLIIVFFFNSSSFRFFLNKEKICKI